VIKHVPEKRPFLKDLIPCLHFSENFKNLENLGGVKLKHLLEIQNTNDKFGCGLDPHSTTRIRECVLVVVIDL